MAMVKVSSPAFHKEGKQGGNIWREDVCGRHVQAHPRIIHPHKESKQQKAFRRAKSAWISYAWTKTEINLWWIWCYRHPVKNKKGETRYLHPFLAFLKVNIKRILAAKDIIYEPPP